MMAEEDEDNEGEDEGREAEGREEEGREEEGKEEDEAGEGEDNGPEGALAAPPGAAPCPSAGLSGPATGIPNGSRMVACRAVSMSAPHSTNPPASDRSPCALEGRDRDTGEVAEREERNKEDVWIGRVGQRKLRTQEPRRKRKEEMR